MKKIYALLTVLMPFLVKGQITITQSDFPVAGSVFINAVNENYTAPVPAGGANQTWNYATLQNLMQDTTGFINAAGTPYVDSFPGANLAAYQMATNAYLYFTTNATGFYINGAALNDTTLLRYMPAQIFVPVPFTHTNTRNGFSRVSIEDSTTRFVAHTAINITADGYGSVILPNATINNTLRLKTTSLVTDSIYVNVPPFGWQPLPGYTPSKSQTTNFKWVRKGSGGVVLDIDADSLGQTSIRSSYLLNYGFVGIQENDQTASALEIYPNPAANYITLDLKNNSNENSELFVYNSLGQQAAKYTVSGINKISLNISDLPNGIYSFVLSDKNAGNTSGKFIISR